MAINDVLLLKADRRDAIANLKCFWASDTRDLTSMVTFTFTMRRHLIRLASAYHLFPPIWQRLVGFGLPCATRGTKQNAEFTKDGWYPILSRLWAKVHEIFRRCRKPLVLSNARFRLSVSRFVQKIFAIKSRSRRKTEKMQKFVGPNFWKRDGSDFSTAVCSSFEFVRATY